MTQPLVIKDERADRVCELVALPLAHESPGGLTQSFRRGRERGLDRVGGGAEIVRGDVGDGPQGEELVVGVDEGPATAGRHQAWIADCAAASGW